jgi:hypothetical protein
MSKKEERAQDSAADNPLVCAHHFNLRDAMGIS